MKVFKKITLTMVMLNSLTGIGQTCPASNTFSNGNGGASHVFNYSSVETLVVDIDWIDNSFVLDVNGVSIHPDTLQMQDLHLVVNEVLLVFQGNLEMVEPWLPNENSLPRVRVEIDVLGNVNLSGTRYTDSTTLEAMIAANGSLFNAISFPSGLTTATITNPDGGGDDGISGTITANETCSALDTQVPSAPTLSSSGNTATTIDLSWSGATDNVGVTGYNVYQDGTSVAANISSTSHQVTGLSASTTYNFTATALDAAGNESPASNIVAVTTNVSSGGGSSGGSVWSESNFVASYTGDVAIGTSSVPSGYKLAVEGNIRTREIRVDQDAWPDYVFEEDYDLPTLEEIQKHINEKGHLPNIPSAAEVKTNGIELGEMDRLLLRKIEELTLYVIQLESQLKVIRNRKDGFKD